MDGNGILICRFGSRRKKKKRIHPRCSVVAVFKMLIRILNTLPSRIWDVFFFSFFWLSKSTVGENGGIVQKVMAFRTKKFRNNKSNCIAKRQAVLVSWMHPEKGGIPPDFRCSGTLVAE